MFGKFYKKFRTNLGKYGLEAFYVGGVFLYLFIVWVPTHFDVWSIAAGFIISFSPVILPALLGILLYHAWLEYKRQEKYWATPSTLLEIRLPEEVTQSPAAAELFIRVLYQSGEVDTPRHNFRGETKPWFSLEIASTEGRVSFYVWTRSRYKDIIKAQLYAHYPTVQVVEVEDYTLNVPWDPERYDLWGIEQRLQKPDPYPIMTYLAWKLDKADTKEEFKNDPLVSLLEFMGSIGPGEHIWSQIIIRAHNYGAPTSYAPWSVEEYHEELRIEEWTEKEKEKLLEKTIVDENDKPNYSKLSLGDKELVDAMERKLNKQLFDVGIRTMYLCKKENKHPGRNAGIPTAFRSFEHGSEGRGLNGLRPIFYIGPFDYPWQDFMGIRRALLKTKMYRGYVSRQYFFEPFKDMHIVLNSEELASLWHFPGKVAHTPTLQRMPSRRAEAPANLPI